MPRRALAPLHLPVRDHKPDRALSPTNPYGQEEAIREMDSFLEWKRKTMFPGTLDDYYKLHRGYMKSLQAEARDQRLFNDPTYFVQIPPRKK